MPAMAKQAAEPKKTAKPKKTFTESREMLAASATLILEEPEKHINELHKIRLAGNTSDERVTKLALLAQLAIFKDIIPGYRIRKLSEKELSTQISKDVKRLRQYEESLLQHYQLYLQQLEKLVSGPAPDGYERDSAPGIALVCMCDLLKSVPHFNFRLNIMTAILAAVRRVRRPDMVDLCCEAFEQLFRDDETGEYSLEAIKLIAKITKQSDYRIHKRVIETFLFLRLAEELQLDEGKRQKVDKGSSKSDKFKDKERKRPKSGRTQHVSKRQKKLSRAEAEVEAEVKEAEATIDRHERQKTHSETLKHVFITYFRILKQLPDSPLIMPALEGLGKFSHLISIDFFTDLLEAIKKICLYQLDKPAEGVQFSQQLSVGLQCILTVLELLASVKDAIKTDLLQFHSAMYRLISRVSLRASLVDPMHLRANYHSDRSIMELMMLALDLMLRRPHEVPIGRIAAFMKRMATMSLSLPDNGAIGSLVAMHKVFLRLPRLQSLLEGDERLGAGVYNPYVDDMDLCNPFATSLWELSTLSSKHYHPMVQSCAKMVLTHSDGSVAKPLPAELQRISRDRPMDLLDRFDAFGGNGLFSLRPACKAPPPMTKQPTNVYGPSVVMQSAFMEQLLARAKT
ncbi:nucleolar complex-associated protein-domain-containing protein [Entophlyctis helioformis]|nr:nucleolar complex-associated protein-domain-containing protein [Entophlyctis helioformis]